MRAIDVGPREREQVVVALEVAPVVAEALAAERRFVELVPLDHRAHRAVEQHDALVEQLLQPLDARRAARSRRPARCRTARPLARDAPLPSDRAGGDRSVVRLVLQRNACSCDSRLGARIACGGRTPSAWQIA